MRPRMVKAIGKFWSRSSTIGLGLLWLSFSSCDIEQMHSNIRRFRARSGGLLAPCCLAIPPPFRRPHSRTRTLQFSCASVRVCLSSRFGVSPWGPDEYHFHTHSVNAKHMLTPLRLLCNARHEVVNQCVSLVKQQSSWRIIVCSSVLRNF